MLRLRSSHSRESHSLTNYKSIYEEGRRKLSGGFFASPRLGCMGIFFHQLKRMCHNVTKISFEFISGNDKFVPLTD